YTTLFRSTRVPVRRSRDLTGAPRSGAARDGSRCPTLPATVRVPAVQGAEHDGCDLRGRAAEGGGGRGESVERHAALGEEASGRRGAVLGPLGVRVAVAGPQVGVDPERPGGVH